MRTVDYPNFPSASTGAEGLSIRAHKWQVVLASGANSVSVFL
jgi:hypothetical protein